MDYAEAIDTYDTRPPSISEKTNAPYVAEKKSGSTGFAALFLFDVTYPDNSCLSRGTTIRKVWRIKNSGSEVWDNCIACRGNYPVHVHLPRSIAIPYCISGGWVDVELELSIPLAHPTGFIRCEYFLRDSNGNPFCVMDCDNIFFEFFITKEE